MMTVGPGGKKDYSGLIWSQQLEHSTTRCHMWLRLWWVEHMGVHGGVSKQLVTTSRPANVTDEHLN